MHPSRSIRLVTERFPRPPGLDTAVSHAIALAVGRGSAPETLRLHQTGRIVAFGRQDRLTPGYPLAVRAARAAGYEAIERLAGGRAAVFHEGTLAFSWAIPTPNPRQGVHERFRDLAEIMVEAFGSLGVDARVGEVPGEYCPGAYSVSVEGRHKVMGVGQRLVRGAAHVGGVIVVRGGDLVREVLVPVYEALGIAWDPSTSGDLQMAVPRLSLGAVESAVVAAFGRRARIVPGSVDPSTLAAAHGLAESHVAPAA